MASLGGTEYAFSRQKLNEIVKALRDCGTEEVVKLPKIAVIGNQSAGKSSLIEAISQIKVPRASGTCTRCPMEVVLSCGDPEEWHCKVSLRFDHSDIAGQMLGTFKFGETDVKDNVPDLLRCAQLAILNPGKSYSSFSNLTEAECKDHRREILFSRNTVVLEITGAPVDVTFIDLPGIISSTEKPEEEHFIALIKNLVAFYVSQKECLILVTISMKDDIDNQSAPAIAREHDPQGLRTIGVLTKPDMVQDGEYEGWLNIMNGRSRMLHHGYFMTRLPANSREMNQTWKESREAERNFFNSRQYWNKLDKSRLGTTKLTEALSARLSTMIEEMLPGLKKDLSDKMRQVFQDLSGLPKSFADDPQANLLSLCSAFTQEVDSYTNGNQKERPSQATFLRDALPHYRILKDLVSDTQPQFTITPAEPGYDPASSEIATPPDKISLEYVRKVIEEMSSRELPGIIPFQVHEHFISTFVSKWEKICLDSFYKMDDILKAATELLCKKHFGRFSSSGLLYEVSAVTCEILDKAAQKAREEIQLYCKMENHRPFTMNVDEYVDIKEKFVTAFAITRHKNNPSYLPRTTNGVFKIMDMNATSRSFYASEETLLAVLAAYGIHLNSMKQLVRIHADEYDAELGVISHVAAYFDISSKRLIDDIPKVFETVFAREFGQELGRVLMPKLKLIGEGGEANCSRYIRDEPTIQVKRDDLTRQQRILQEALDTIDRFFK